MKQNHAEKYNPTNIAVKDIDFELMSKTYFLPLCRYAEQFVNQYAEDMVQDVFRIMWEKRHTMPIIEKLSSYLYRGVHNQCLKRQEHIKVERKYNEHVQRLHEEGDWLTAPNDKDPLFLLIYQEKKREIEKMIEDFPEQRREILLLRNEELSYQEIAEKLGVTIGTVKKQINRAMTKIWESLGISGILNKRKK